MLPYRLAPCVYACASDAGAVLLNLHTDAYVGIDPVQSRALALVVADWPGGSEGFPGVNGTRSIAARLGDAPDALARSPSSCTTTPSTEDALALAKVLCDSGLVIPSSIPRQSILTAPPVAEIESELIPWEHMEWRHIRIRHVLCFVLSLLTAIVLLRSRRFAVVVERARARKQQHANSNVPLHAPTVRSLLSAFFHIRAFFYAPKSRCLLDSLTLLEFLAHYRQFPQWVIGVQIAPFGSHSWIQHDEFVLNGTSAYVRAYTPILSI